MERLTEPLRKSEERAGAGQLALEVMHEVRSSLEALANLNYLTTLETENADQVRTYARLPDEQIAALSRIADDSLDFARLTVSPTPCELTELAEAALRIHRHAIAANKIHVVKDFPDSIGARIHRAQILQVLSNLIDNALDALPPEGTLSFCIRNRNDEVHLILADNGHGLHPSHENRVFEPFFTTKKDRGTGLGLSLRKRIVERHDGKICLRTCVRTGESGTIFNGSLPA